LISLMLVSALWTLFRSDWSTWNAVLVSLGAILFYSSDLTNAWIRFVNPVRGGRVVVMITYHAGQILLMVGVVLNWYLYSKA
ncbi:MAG: lysoplasmalogenase family protein, partial [Chloroflexota bacterium]